MGACLLKRTSRSLRQDVAGLFPVNHTKILVGCAPCQPFSTYTRGKKERKLHKWGLLSAFGRIIREADPDIVSMENVPQLERKLSSRDLLPISSP